MNYEEDIKIDETSLEIEWLNQPSLMMKYSRHAANMQQELDVKRQELDVTKAELDKAIRENPSNFSISKEIKITEAVVTGAILKSKRYKLVYSEYLDAKYEYDVAQAAVKAFEHRKVALENLVKLFIGQYFAGPAVPRDISWERQQKQKKVDDGIASKLKRSK